MFFGVEKEKNCKYAPFARFFVAAHTIRKDKKSFFSFFGVFFLNVCRIQCDTEKREMKTGSLITISDFPIV